MGAGQRPQFDLFDIAAREILDTIEEGVVITGLDDRIVFVNRAAYELLGCRERDAVGRDRAALLGAPLATGDGDDGPVESCYGGPLATRTVRVLATLKPISDARGRRAGSLEVFRSLTSETTGEAPQPSGRGRGRLVGASAAMCGVLRLVDEAAATTAPVLVTGGAGVGKRTVALAIHESGDRDPSHFVSLDCAIRGERELGRALRRLAERGQSTTLYLERVDRLDAANQAALGEILAASAAGSRARVIASTREDIESAVDRGRFDRDLFYLLNTVAIQVPALCERIADVPLLADHIIAALNGRLRGRAIAGLSPEASDLLNGYTYPENVRELEQILEHAFSKCRGKTIRLRHLPERIVVAQAAASESAGDDCDQSASVELLERDFIVAVLEENRWQLNVVAERLGLSRTTLWRKLKRLGIENPRRS